MIESRRRWQIVWSYLPDWLFSICLGILFWILQRITGFRRDFSLTDTSLQYTYAEHQRIPEWLLVVLCFVVPLCLMPLVNLVTLRSPWDLHNSLLGLVLALSITGSITNVIKVTVGRPRPDVINRCLPIRGAVNDAVFGLASSAICQQPNERIMRDGWRSFPSGHSSLSFAGLGFLAFYLAGKLHLFDQRGHTLKAWLALAPFIGAALVAISRTMDYRHHWSDVFIGSLLGTLVAYFSYRQYYPCLADPLSHRPYGPRIPASPPEPYTKRYNQGHIILPPPVTSPTYPRSSASSTMHTDVASITRSDHPLTAGVANISRQGSVAGSYSHPKRKPLSRKDSALLLSGAAQPLEMDEVVPRHAPAPLRESWDHQGNKTGLQRPTPAAMA